jgi:Effector Associated Constant Component 1
MELSLSIPNEKDQESLLSLYEWLEDDRDIRKGAEVNLIEAPLQRGSMAGEFELISLLMSSGFNIGSLAIAFASWRASRTASPPVRIEAKGLEITIDSDDSRVIERALKMFSGETNGKGY